MAGLVFWPGYGVAPMAPYNQCMKISGRYLLVFALIFLFSGPNCNGQDEGKPVQPIDQSSFGAAQLAGRIEAHRLVECSGLETSLVTGDLLWAVNDGGHGPFLYALGSDGRNRGRVLVAGAQNRDWEGLETFFWRGRPMILIADFGDNDEQYDTHTLYIVAEPPLYGERYGESAIVDIAWRIVFLYPDRKHDAEGVAVDTVSEKILVLTKRDNPPLLFELPLRPPSTDQHIVAHHVTTVGRIPPPSDKDLLQKHGTFQSQPTSLDFSTDGLQAVVLTYKHAYLFKRSNHDSWGKVLSGNPILIPLPLPHNDSDLRQREAICFTPDGRSLLVTSEGRGAGIFRLEAR